MYFAYPKGRVSCVHCVLLCTLAFLAAVCRPLPLPAQNPAGKMTVTGVITDSEGETLPGASVLIKGTRTGVSADLDGKYTISFPAGKTVTLVYSFIGMENVEKQVNSSTVLNVSMKSDTQLDAVVINGFYAQAKETFTGAATTISGEEIVQLAPTNLLSGIAAMTPGMVIVENNVAGSNPNAIPSILIRGANTLITNESEEGVNNPLIVLDGVEISLEELYDLDIFDIERIDVLKDASATILYGEKGANGVIVVERKRIGNEKVKMSYNFVPKYSIPDLSSFHLTNAAQKLEFERIAGLYDTADGSMDQAYDYKLQNVRKGIDTDWMRAPLRIPFSHNHSVSLTSRGEKLDFSANAHANDSYGVMKGDNRRNFGITFNIGYHMRDKLTLSYKNSFTMTDTKDSPYGSFVNYSKMNRYEPVFDEDGQLRKTIPFNPFSASTSSDSNPLYDATLASFNKGKSISYSNSLNGRWNITKYFYITAQGHIGLSFGTSDIYDSPATAKNLLKADITRRGSYTFARRNGLTTDGKIVINYGKSLDTRGSMFRISGGANIQYSRSQSASGIGEGFLKDELSDISFALNYASGQPTGSDRITTSAGFFANGNLSFRNRYFVDLSYRSSGSSRFGAANSFAPFWSAGAGWNIHNEKAVKDIKWINSLVLRYSVGYTGSVSFDYYQAKTIYQYKSGYQYYTGIGALPRQMGNADLKWQRTLNNNAGLTAALFGSRLNLSLDYYNNTTYDMLMPINLPPSVGTSSMQVNFGQINNQGVDLSLSFQILRSQDWFWSMTLTGGHVMDQIRNISSALKGTEKTYYIENGGTADTNTSKVEDTSKPRLLFEEGGSQFDIYAMRSAGIDPATGEEIFIKRNGEYTYVYDADERIAVGNTNPILRGALINTLRYKGFSLSVSTTYTFGGDYYNSTLQNKVENITDPYHNVDERAFTDRWKAPGDLSRYVRIDTGEDTSHYSERFVERRNELYISSIQFTYDFKPKAISRLGMRKLIIGLGMSDIGYLSTVKFERGTSYPYCRSFNLIFRPTF